MEIVDNYCTERSGEMKCYYCHQACEGLVFEQGNFSIVAHRDCAVKKLEKDCDLIIRTKGGSYES